MKYTIYIDQLTLEFWFGKKIDPKRYPGKNIEEKNHIIDATDCLILAFIADMNPQEPGIKEHMWRGHFLITRRWILQQLPIIQISEDRIYRRLRWLKNMGILDVIHKSISGKRQLAYYKLSALYWKIKNKRHSEAEKAAKEVKAVVDSDVRDNEKAIVDSTESHSCCQLGNESIKDSMTTLDPPGLRSRPADQVEKREEDEEEEEKKALAEFHELQDSWKRKAS